jgi:hypothetical protein
MKLRIRLSTKSLSKGNAFHSELQSHTYIQLSKGIEHKLDTLAQSIEEARALVKRKWLDHPDQISSSTLEDDVLIELKHNLSSFRQLYENPVTGLKEDMTKLQALIQQILSS